MSELEDLLIEAMNSELEAQQFYVNAAEKAQSQAGKNFFNELAEFEQNHYNKVKQIFDSLESIANVPETEEIHNIKHINSEIEGEFEPNKDEIITVINMAIDAEKMAQERYDTIADMLDDQKSKTIFDNLAQDERNHQKILEDELYHLSNKGTIIWE